MSDTWTAAERAVLAERARALAAPAIVDAVRVTEAAVVVSMGAERCALPIPFVHGVVRLTRLTRLPGVPRHVAGLFAHEAEVLPAFDLHTILDVGLVALPEYSRAVLVGRQAAEAALIVERIDAVVDIAIEELRDPPTDLSPRLRMFLRGIAADGLPVVDGAALLHSDALYVGPGKPVREGPSTT